LYPRSLTVENILRSQKCALSLDVPQTWFSNWPGDDTLSRNFFHVHGSVHHSKNHLEITNKMRPCIRIYYSKVSYCSTCFERPIAHHQELKLYLQLLVFTYVCGYRPPAGNHKRM